MQDIRSNMSTWDTAHVLVASCTASPAAIPGFDVGANVKWADFCDDASDRTTEAGNASPRSILSACDEPCEIGNATRRTLWADLEDTDEELDTAELSCDDTSGSSLEEKRFGSMLIDESTQVDAQIGGDKDKDERGGSATVSKRPTRASRRARRAAEQAAGHAEVGWKMEASENCKSDSSTWWGKERSSNFASKTETKDAGKGRSAGKGAAPDADTKGYGK
jgi:hypothetical protein